MSGDPTDAWHAKRLVGRIKGKPEVNVGRETALTFVRSIFESDYIIDDTPYHDIGMAAYFVSGEKGEVAGLLFACPGCGQVTSINFKVIDQHHTWSWNNDRDKPSALPSIVHNPTKGGCGWHGFLSDGRMQMQPPTPWVQPT